MKSLRVPFKKGGRGGFGKTKHPLSEECTLVFVSAAQFVFVTNVTFIPHLLSRFTVFSCSRPSKIVFSANIAAVIPFFLQRPIKRVVNDQVSNKTKHIRNFLISL